MSQNKKLYLSQSHSQALSTLNAESIQIHELITADQMNHILVLAVQNPNISCCKDLTLTEHLQFTSVSV